MPNRRVEEWRSAKKEARMGWMINSINAGRAMGTMFAVLFVIYVIATK